jgi:hypothetical protein
MPRLGDRFPEGARRAYINERLVPGAVLRLYCQFIDPPKEKYLILACVDPESLLFFVNSEVHPFIQSRPDLAKCQVALRASDCGFLDHDSFADCSHVIRLSHDEDILTELLNNTAGIVDQLPRHVMDDILRVVRMARTIAAADKRAIEAALAT